MRHLLVAAVAANLLAGTAWAAENAIVVEQPWARAAATGNSAAYLVIENRGTAPDRLVGVASPAARTAELHTSQVDAKGVASMRPLQAVELTPGGKAVLAPGGMHIMLMGLAQPLKDGQHFPLTLTFEKAGAVTVDVAVQGRPTAGHDHQKPMNMGN